MSTPKAQFEPGQFAIYIPPLSPSEENLMIIDSRAYLETKEKSSKQWHYNGRCLKIVKTRSSTLPFVPLFNCGITCAPEKNLRKLETIL